MKKQILLARKYASAYMAIEGTHLTREQRECMIQAQKFLQAHPTVLFMLSMPQLTISDVERLIAIFITTFSLPASLQKLATLLQSHKRLGLFSQVLMQIEQLCQEHYNEQPLLITSSHVLSDEALKKLVTFFAHETKQHIIPTHAVDPSLIAGIRLQSPTFLWEHSVRKQLHELRLPLIKGHYEY